MAKFENGNPGGPGRPRGSRGAVNFLLDRLAAGSAETIVKKMVAAASDGDRAAAALVLGRIWPAPKGRPVEIDLPEVKTPADLMAAHGAVAAAISAGAITPQDGGAIATVLERHRRAFELVAQEERVERLEAAVRTLQARLGGPVKQATPEIPPAVDKRPTEPARAPGGTSVAVPDGARAALPADAFRKTADIVAAIVAKAGQAVSHIALDWPLHAAVRFTLAKPAKRLDDASTQPEIFPYCRRQRTYSPRKPTPASCQSINAVSRGSSEMSRIHLPRRRVLTLAGGALAAPMIASGIARAADDWPNKPVKYINLFPAGGPTDVLSRIACQKLSEMTGQQFIVDNKGGSGGNVGAEAIAHSPPDGYTIGLMSVSSHAIAPTLYTKLPFNADKDFTPVTMLWSLPNLLVVRKGVPAKTVPELIALAKASPGKYTYASSGAGTTVHLSGALFCYMAKIDLLHVPYRGSAPATQDLLAGQVDMIFDNIPGSLAQMAGGHVNGLAVTSLERSPKAPDVPAMTEFLPGFDINSWGGICGPAGLPPAMVEKLSALSKQALESDAVKNAYLKNGATPFWKSHDDTVAYRRAEEKRFAPIVKASGAKVD